MKDSGASDAEGKGCPVIRVTSGDSVSNGPYEEPGCSSQLSPFLALPQRDSFPNDPRQTIRRPNLRVQIPSPPVAVESNRETSPAEPTLLSEIDCQTFSRPKDTPCTKRKKTHSPPNSNPKTTRICSHAQENKAQEIYSIPVSSFESVVSFDITKEKLKQQQQDQISYKTEQSTSLSKIQLPPQFTNPESPDAATLKFPEASGDFQNVHRAPIPQRLAKILALPRVELIINFLVFLDWLILASVSFKNPEEKPDFGPTFLGYSVVWPYRLRYLLNGIFLIELIAKFYAHGLFFSLHQFPIKENSSKNRLGSDAGSRRRAASERTNPNEPPPMIFSILGFIDLVSVSAFWINAILCIPEFGFVEWSGWSLLVALSALRPLRLVTVIPQFSSIIRSLSTSLPLLGNLAFFLAYFFLLFGTVGLVLFKGHGRTLCTRGGDIAWPYRYCSGEYTGEGTGPKVRYVDKPDDGYADPLFSGYICPYPLLCGEATFKDNAYLMFDTIYYAILTVYVVSSVEKWTDIMYRVMATVSPWASVFFITCVMALNYWLVTLFVAVIARIFEKLREDKEFAKYLAAKTSAPAPMVDKDFEFQLVHSPRGAALPTASHNKPKANGRLRLLRVENAMLKALPACNFLAFLLIGVDLLTRSYHVRQFTTFPHVYLPINVLLLIESSLQLLKLRHPGARRAAPNLSPDFEKWMDRGIWVYFFLCLVNITVMLFQDLLGDKAMAIFSIFAIARLFRLVFAVPRIRTLVFALAARFAGIISLLGFILVCILLVAPLGMHLVCLSMIKGSESDDVIAYFGSLPRAMLTLFQIFSGEDWPEVMIEATSVSTNASKLFIILFFVVWSGFSNFILLNLFIALTMESFELAETYKHRSQVRAYVESATKACADKSRDPISFWNPYRYLTPSPSLVKLARFPKALSARIPSYLAQRLMRFQSVARPHQTKRPPDALLSERDYLSAEFDHSHPMYDASWFLFRPAHPLRRLCRQLAEPNYKGWSLVFNMVVWAAVIAAVAVALINTPEYRLKTVHEHEGSFVLHQIDLVLAAFFLIEFGVRTVADGFLLTPNAYLKHPWYVLDFMVLVLFLVDLNVSPLPASHFNQVVRGLKAFRALRLMSLVPKVKDTIYGVFIVGFPRILDVSLLLMTFIVPYALYGHLLFSAQGDTCSDPLMTSISECVDEFIHPGSGVLMPRAWDNYNTFSFETFGGSLLVLVEILSGEKWVSVMDRVMEFSGEGFAANGYVNWWYCLYFVLYYIVGSIIALSMFVAVIIENYRRYTGAARLTSNQRRWIDLRKQLRQTAPSMRPMCDITPLQLWCRRRATEKDGVWPNMVSTAHALLLLCLVTEYHGQDWELSQYKNYALVPLLVVSALDPLSRILGLGWAAFLRGPWVPAHAVVTGIALAVTLASIFSDKKFYLYDLSNILCLGVTLKLMFRSNRLSELAIMAAASLPDILMTLYAWLVLFLTYSILFMQIFGLTRYGELGSDGANFRNFGLTLMMLFRMTTGESWNDVMHDYTVQTPFCVFVEHDYLGSDCGSPVLALTLFLSFNVLSMFIFANLFVVIVMDNFNYCHDVAASFTLLTRADIRHFKHTWCLFDQHARGYIPTSALIPFLMSLKHPFAMRYLDPQFTITGLLESYASLGPADPGDMLAYAKWLDGKLAQMPRHRSERHRRRFNTFYLHVMTTEEPGKGLSFTNVLLLLSQYKLIDPDQCLSIQDLLQFKQARKEIYNSYYRQKALGMCRTWILRRNFLRNLRMKHAPPMIFVDDSLKSGLQIPHSHSGNGHASDRSSCSYSLPRHSPATSTSSSSWFIPPLPTILCSSPCSDTSDIEESTAQHIMASLAHSPWAICLNNAIKNNGSDEGI